jgi:hypothetical protein
VTRLLGDRRLVRPTANLVSSRMPRLEEVKREGPAR